MKIGGICQYIMLFMLTSVCCRRAFAVNEEFWPSCAVLESSVWVSRRRGSEGRVLGKTVMKEMFGEGVSEALVAGGASGGWWMWRVFVAARRLIHKCSFAMATIKFRK